MQSIIRSNLLGLRATLVLSQVVDLARPVVDATICTMAEWWEMRASLDYLMEFCLKQWAKDRNSGRITSNLAERMREEYGWNESLVAVTTRNILDWVALQEREAAQGKSFPYHDTVVSIFSLYPCLVIAVSC
jgi:hypothetical protein